MDQNLISPTTWLHFRKWNCTILHWWLYNPVSMNSKVSCVLGRDSTCSSLSQWCGHTQQALTPVCVALPGCCPLHVGTATSQDRAAAQLSPSLANRRRQSCPHTSGSFRHSPQQSGTRHMKATLALQSSFLAWYLPYKMCQILQSLRKAIS